MISLMKPALAARPPLLSRHIFGIIIINLAYLVGCSAMATQGSPLTTHVLNTGEGIPGRRMALSLHRLDSQSAVWNLLTSGTTDDDGRCPGLITREAFAPGMYKMRFETGEYFQALGQTCFYPYVEIVFNITDPTQKFHLPLLLSRFSYSTYRGS